MKNLYVKYMALLVLILSGNSLFAQKAETPDFNYSLGAKINEMTLTEGGTLVVATNDGLVGVKPGTNDLLFNFTDYGRVKPEELTYVPMAPYVMVGQVGFANLSTKKAVIDYISGKVLFSTENNGWKTVMSCDVMMPQNKLGVSGQRKAKEKYAMQVAVYDLNTGNEDYRFNLDEPGRVGIAKDYSVTGRPLLLEDYLIVPTAQGLVAKKAKTGETLWDNKMKDINWMVVDETGKEIYAFESVNQGKNTRIHKVGVNGEALWKEDQKVKGVVSNFQILPNGIAVVSNKSDGGRVRLFTDASLALDNLLAAATHANIKLKINSAYRTYTDQERVYNQNCSRGGCKPPTASPGRSNHGFGLAVDLANSGGAKLATSMPEYTWVVENASRFGFKRIASEAWHWEYQTT